MITEYTDLSNRLTYFNTSHGEILGHHAHSENNVYCLVWSGGSGFMNGKRTQGLCFLFKNGIEVYKRKFKRPEFGQVANNGIFVIDDALPDSVMSSILLIADDKGNEIVKKRYKRNMFATALAMDGSIGGCWLANPDNRFVLFDTKNGEQIHKKSMISPVERLPENESVLSVKLEGMYQYAIIDLPKTL